LILSSCPGHPYYNSRAKHTPASKHTSKANKTGLFKRLSLSCGIAPGEKNFAARRLPVMLRGGLYVPVLFGFVGA
jgi:hypothetical protein